MIIDVGKCFKIMQGTLSGPADILFGSRFNLLFTSA